MVLTFKLQDGDIVFDEDGNIVMVGVGDAFDLDEMLQRLEIRLQTLILTDKWRPLEGFDLMAITDSRANSEYSGGLTKQDIIKSVVYATVMQDPEVDGVEQVEAEVDADSEYGRRWMVFVAFRTVHDKGTTVSLKMDVMVI